MSEQTTTGNIIGNRRTYICPFIAGCDSLAEQGNCDFYRCEEAVFPCGNDGYALGYGYRYCHRFGIFYKHFDTVVSLTL